MAIIVEIKSRRNCCRKNVLTEEEKGFLKFFSDMISGEGKSFSKAVASEIQTAVVGKIVDEIFDVGNNPKVKATILYKTFVRALGNIDLKDIRQLLGDEKDVLCRTIATNLIKAVADIVTDEITDEMKYAIDQKAGNMTGILGKIAPAIQKMTGAANTVGDFLEKMSTEQMKDEGALDQLSDAICEIDFLELVKGVPGVGSIIGAFSEE